MGSDNELLVPARRTTELVVRDQGDETLVLDTRNDQVHCLAADVALVWNACFGDRNVAQIATATGLDVDTVSASVDELGSLELLDVVRDGFGRRQFLRRSVLVGGAALSVPLIQTVLAPSAFAAGCSTNQLILSQGGQDSCTGNAAHAKYTIGVKGCAPNTNYYPLLFYKDDTGTLITEVGKTLRTGADGSDTTNGESLTNKTLKNGSSTVTLRLYSDQNHTNLVSEVSVLFSISCP